MTANFPHLPNSRRETPLSGVGRVEAPPPGWYEDPYGRWRARYWDGLCWTERVANRGADPTQPEYGTDPLFATDTDHATELAHARAEADHWRRVAEARQRALDALGVVEQDGNGTPRADTSTPPDVDRVPRAASRDYAAIRPHVRDMAAALVAARTPTTRARGRRRKKG